VGFRNSINERVPLVNYWIKHYVQLLPSTIFSIECANNVFQAERFVEELSIQNELKWLLYIAIDRLFEIQNQKSVKRKTSIEDKRRSGEHS